MENPATRTYLHRYKNGLFFDDHSLFKPDETPGDGIGWRAYTTREIKDDGRPTGRLAYVIWYPDMRAAMIVPSDTALSGGSHVEWTDAASPKDALRRWIDGNMSGDW